MSIDLSSPKIASQLPPGPKLNLGCGPVQPTGWVNVDGSMRAKLAAWLPRLDRLMTRLRILSPTCFGPQVKILNLHKPLPWRDGSVSAIYAGELWEHFEPQVAERLTRECLRVLAPGGVLRVCVPDDPAFFKRYFEAVAEECAKPHDERNVDRLRKMVEVYWGCICTRRPGLSSMGHYHKWSWDEVQLIDLFERCGFHEVNRHRRHESRIPDVSLVEGRNDFLMVEGTKQH